MNISYFCPRWGSESIAWDQFLLAVKSAGYDGVEIGIPDDEQEKNRLIDKIKEHGLVFIAQHWETDHSDFELHKKIYQSHLKRLVSSNPYQINSHTGRDYFTFDQNLELIDIASELEKEGNTIISHETHRSRFPFAAHATVPFLKSRKNLCLTLDVSHWICVAESLLYDQKENLEFCLPRVRQIHARIGHTQGPQVDDFRLTKWKETVNRHFEIWDNTIDYHQKRGTENMAITTEFGPPPYMIAHPQTSTAVEFQFELNCAMLKELKERY